MDGSHVSANTYCASAELALGLEGLMYTCACEEVTQTTITQGWALGCLYLSTISYWVPGGFQVPGGCWK